MSDPTEAALLRAVLERPDDDAARLVLADWWEEYGNPGRSDFLRRQSALVDSNLSDEEADLYRRWVGKWVEDDGPDWLIPPFPGLKDFDWTWSQPAAGEVMVEFGDAGPNLPYPFVVIWRCGFIDEFHCRLVDFTEVNARTLFSAHPVTRVVLADRTPELDGADRLGWLNREQIAKLYPTFAFRDSPARLPDALWRHLPPAEAESSCWKHYRPADLAVPALSTACVSWGRSLVGLPPLPAPACPPPGPG